MSTRVKQMPLYTISTIAQADIALAEIAETNRYLNIMNAELNERIDLMKLEAEDSTKPIKDRRTELEQALLSYATQYKKELFSNNKTWPLTFGKIGFRESTTLKAAVKGGFKRVLELVREHNPKYIRIKEDVNKELLRGASPETMQKVGVYLQKEDTFFYEINEEYFN